MLSLLFDPDARSSRIPPPLPLVGVIVGSLLLVGVGGDVNHRADRRSPSSAAAPATERGVDKPNGVCVYQGAPVRKSPGSDGEYMTALNVGETVTVLEKTKMAKRGDEKQKYSKIRLKGGKKGWVRSDMIEPGATPAAVRSKTVIHERPTLMAGTDTHFNPMDVVAVVDSQESFVKVKGMRRDANWWDTGWIKPDALTQKKVDVAVAGLWTKARADDDTAKRQEAIKRIIDSPALSKSVFADSLKARLD